MCGSSAAKSYGSLGSSCAMPSSSSVGRSRHRTSALTNRQHAIERHLRPVLLLVRNGDAIVHAALDQLFKNPEQMVRGHAEHRRAETAELVERHDGAIGRDIVGETIDEMNLGAHRPYGSGRAALHRREDVFSA